MAAAIPRTPNRKRCVRFMVDPEDITDGSVLPPFNRRDEEDGDLDHIHTHKQTHGKYTLSLLEELLQQDDVDQCCHLLEKPETLAVFQDMKLTPLHLAAKWGALKVMLRLVQTCPNLDICTGDYVASTPLHWAIQYGHLVIVETLIKSGANCHRLNIFGDDVVYVAVYYQHKNLLSWIIQQGFEVNAIRVAVMDLVLRHKSSYDLLRLLLDARYDIDHKWDKQRSLRFITLTSFPLVYAVGLPDSQVFHLLLDYGCDIDHIHKALIETTFRGNVEAFLLLVHHSSTKLSPEILKDVLLFAVKNRQVAIVRHILQQKHVNLQEYPYVAQISQSHPLVSLQSSTRFGMNAYYPSRPKGLIHPAHHLASVHHKCQVMMEDFLFAGADINLQSMEYGESPLFAACAGSCLCLAWQLLLHRADVHLATKHKNTPLAVCMHLHHQQPQQVYTYRSDYKEMAELLMVFMVDVWSELALSTNRWTQVFEDMNVHMPERPASLQHQCRRTILFYLTHPRVLPSVEQVAQLGLPPRLQDYICLGGNLRRLFEHDRILSSNEIEASATTSADFHIFDAKFATVKLCGCWKSSPL